MGHFGDEFEREIDQQQESLKQGTDTARCIIKKSQDISRAPQKQESKYAVGNVKSSRGTPADLQNGAGKKAARIENGAATKIKPSSGGTVNISSAATGAKSAGAAASSAAGSAAGSATAGTSAGSIGGSAAGTAVSTAAGAAVGSTLPIVGTIIGAIAGTFGSKILKAVIAVIVGLVILIGSFPSTISNKVFALDQAGEPPQEEYDITDAYLEKARLVNEKFEAAYMETVENVENKINSHAMKQSDLDPEVVNPEWIQQETMRICHLPENYHNNAQRTLSTDDVCFVLSAYGVAAAANKMEYDEALLENEEYWLEQHRDWQESVEKIDKNAWYAGIASFTGDFAAWMEELTAQDIADIKASLLMPPDGKLDRLMKDLEWEKIFSELYPVTVSEAFTKQYDVPQKYESFVPYEGIVYTAEGEQATEEFYIREDPDKPYRHGNEIGEIVPVCEPATDQEFMDGNGNPIAVELFIRTGEQSLGAETGYPIQVVSSFIGDLDQTKLLKHLGIDRENEYGDTGCTYGEVIDFYMEAIKAFLPENLLYGDILDGDNWYLQFLIEQLEITDPRRAILQAAADQLGIAYGGNAGYPGDRETTHRDCSSFVAHSFYNTFSDLGYRWFKTDGWSWSTSMLDSTFQNTDYSKDYRKANIGDILMWKGHTGIYLGEFSGKQWIVDCGTESGVSVRELFSSPKWPLTYAIDPFADMGLEPIVVDEQKAMEYFSSTVAGALGIGGDHTDQVVGTCTVSATEIDRIMPPAMKGLGEAFRDASITNHIDIGFLIALAYHESGRGTSRRAREQNNLFGWGNTVFDSKEECVRYVASRIKARYIDKGLVTIDSIGDIYCPVGADNDIGLNQYWKSGVTKLVQEVNTQLGLR